MNETPFQFYALSETVSDQLGFDAIPFPVRAKTAESLFSSQSVDADALLAELDLFVRERPENRQRYAANAAQLAMICATNHVQQDNFMAALADLSAGLRIAPQHRGLKVHQALALQVTGYTEAAAYEYEQMLWEVPAAFDPLIRALATKAWLEVGKLEKATAVLEMLPKSAFHDPAMARLRAALGKLPATPTRTAEPQPATPAQKNFCMRCGAKLRTGKKFCTQCGAPV